MLFVNGFMAIREDGQYALSYRANHYMLPQRAEREPANLADIQSARRARELGLAVVGPAPIWVPSPDVPIGGAVEDIEALIARAVESIHFRQGVALGRKVVEQRSLHDMFCRCGDCPHEYRYARERELGDEFAPAEGIIPDTWWMAAKDGHRRAVKVQSADGRWLIEGFLAGDPGWGTMSSSEEARRYGAPDEVCNRLDELRAAWDARWAARRAEEAEKERRQLAAKFGLS